ncbi:MAG: acyl carrier protein [Candidatus Omnitrophica bacterium]|nr:acyl carrier protein [Candidatus Omnitrophota bacterium]
MTQKRTAIDIEKDIRELVAEILETEPEQIRGDAKFVKDLGMDSMMALEVLASIEKKYRIIIPEDKLAQFVDLNTTVAIVRAIMDQ